jgi:hypothetical protein
VAKLYRIPARASIAMLYVYCKTESERAKMKRAGWVAVQAFAQLLPDLLQRGRHPLADRLPVNLEVSRLMVLPTTECLIFAPVRIVLG